MTTTIRVDAETHAKLLELGSTAGVTLMQTVADAAEALRRQRFAHQVVAELETLQSSETDWSEYLAEAARTDVDDGVR